MTDIVLDSQDFEPTKATYEYDHNGGRGKANNYALSHIRAWLNSSFYNTAFNDAQKAIVKTTTVDNSEASTGQTDNHNVCENTNDKMFLLSLADVQNEDYGFTSDITRQCKGSKYAIVQGLHVADDDMTVWWLRTANDNSNIDARYMHNSGVYYYTTGVSRTHNGIRPACWIRL